MCNTCFVTVLCDIILIPNSKSKNKIKTKIKREKKKKFKSAIFNSNNFLI